MASRSVGIRPNRRRTAVLSVAVAAVATLAVLAGALPQPAAARAATASATTIVRVRPVSRAGVRLPGFSVTRTYRRASCVAGSEAIGAAYRCFAGNIVADPCWVQHDRHFVTCLARPWDHSVIRLHVTKGYSGGPPGPPAGRSHPWGVRTSTVASAGAHGRALRCLRSQGATGSVGGKPITYVCGRHYGLAGRIDRSSPLWSAELVRQVGSGFVPGGTVMLPTAWFGKPSLQG